MKNYAQKVLVFAIFVIAIIISCRKEIPDKPDESLMDISEARLWYENLYSAELSFKSADLAKGKLHAKPNWNLAFRSNHKDSKTVETPLITEGEIGFASKQSYDAFKETGNKNYILSRTTVVIEKKGNKTTGFLMTVVPDKEYQEENNFNSFSSSYRKWQKGFSGIVLYHNLDGSFSNGWRLLKGKVVNTVKHKNDNGIQVQLSSKGCVDWYWVQWEYSYNMDFKGTNGWVYNEQWTYLYTTCDSGGGGGEGGSGGGATTEAVYIPESMTPCNGDPMQHMEIAPTSLDGELTTGMFGCVRPGSDERCVDKDYHGGADLACEPGTDVYSMKGGVVIDMENSIPLNQNGPDTPRGKLGNFVDVRYTSGDGKTTDVIYAHLSYVNVSIGSDVEWGQIIGSSGKTGNAWNVPNPHLHVQITQDGILTDPTGYFASYISPNGLVLDPCSN
jgi:hypothetical protein